MNQPADSTEIRWGILGTARIATKVGRAITQAAGSQLAAIASREPARARAWIDRHTQNDHAATTPEAFLEPARLPKVVGGYQALLDDPSIDAVYIPLPPSLHAEWTIAAARSGKHVLCEKPLAVNVSEARAMAAACEAAGVQLMDGVMWVHHPRTDAMKRTIASGVLGRLRRVTSAFSFNARDFQPDNIRFQRALGGGVLGDLGWYNIRATLWAFDALPERVFASARYRNDVDLSLSALMWFDDERVASFDCAYDTAARKWFEIAGTEGSLVCDDFVHPWNVDQARYWVHGGQGKMSQENCAPCHHEVRMIEHFCEALRSGRLEPAWPAAAIACQAVLDALDRSARSGQIAPVPPIG
jgi:predicted dehydrogenase